MLTAYSEELDRQWNISHSFICKMTATKPFAIETSLDLLMFECGSSWQNEKFYFSRPWQELKSSNVFDIGTVLELFDNLDLGVLVIQPFSLQARTIEELQLKLQTKRVSGDRSSFP